MQSDAQASACLAFLEAAHAWEMEEAAWLQALVDTAVGIWGTPSWAAAYLYDASQRQGLRFGKPAIWGGSPAVEQLLTDGLASHATRPQTIYMYRTFTFGFGRPLRGMDERGEEILAQTAAADMFGLNGLDASGLGCFVGIGAERTELDAQELVLYQRLAAHLSSAYRCRRRLRAGSAGAVSEAEAILDEEGRVLDARGPAESRAAREELNQAARSMQTVRRRRGEDEPTSGWRPRIEGRWTLVDAADGGTRVIAARENQTRATGLDALTDREQQVVASAVTGRSPKEIAYDLGISHATARVLLARSYRRLGVRTQKELFDLPSIRILRGVAA